MGPDHTPGWGGRERSLHRSPKELFSPCLYLEAQLLCSEGGPLEQGAGMSQCSDSHTPGGCLLPWPPAAALSPGSPVSLFLVVGGSLGPVSAWKLWVSQGTLSSPLVLDEPLGPPSWPDPHPASLCNASHPPTPLPSPHSGRLFVDTPGQCGKGASASLLAALPGQSCLARWGLCVAPTISRGKPWMPAPGAGGIEGTRPVTVSGVREAIRRESRMLGVGPRGSQEAAWPSPGAAAGWDVPLPSGRVDGMGEAGLPSAHSLGRLPSWPRTAPVWSDVSENTRSFLWPQPEAPQDHPCSLCWAFGSAATRVWNACP